MPDLCHTPPHIYVEIGFVVMVGLKQIEENVKRGKYTMSQNV